MPTIEDLRGALGALKDQAFTEVSVLYADLRADHRQPNHRRIYLPLLVAAAVAATVTGTVVEINSRSSSNHKVSAAAASSPSNSAAPAASATTPASSLATYPFSVGALPDGLGAFDSVTSPEGDIMGIESTQGEGAGSIEVYPASATHPSIPANAVAVKIGAQTGYYSATGGTADSVAVSTAAAGETAPTTSGDPTVIWQDSSGRWASVTGIGVATNTTAKPHDVLPGSSLLSLTQAQLVAVANATHIGTPHAAKVPIKLSYVPAGLQLEGVEAAYGPALTTYGGSGVLTLGQPGGNEAGLYIGIGTGKDQATDANTRKVTIGDFTGSYSPSYTMINLTNSKGVSIYIGHSDMSSVALDELTKVVQGLTLASAPSDPSTWFDAATALP